MSRSGWHKGDDGDIDQLLFEGRITAMLGSARAVRFLTELVEALDALPSRRLIERAIEREGEICAIGAMCRARKVDISTLPPHDMDLEDGDVDGDELSDALAARLEISGLMARQVQWINDDSGRGDGELREQYRWLEVRGWAMRTIKRARERLQNRGYDMDRLPPLPAPTVSHIPKDEVQHDR